MIDTDVGIKDHTIFTYEIAGGHRQRPVWISIMPFEIDAEGEINFSQAVGNGEG